jgi:hypothetical protein
MIAAENMAKAVNVQRLEWPRSSRMKAKPKRPVGTRARKGYWIKTLNGR